MCFWRLGSTGLVSMEGMVVDGARHMLASGDWLVPRVYGEIYTYKPAFAYWLAAVPLQLFDQPGEWLVRVPFATLGFLLGLSVLVLIGRVVGPRIGLFCSAATLLGGLSLQKLTMAEFDVALVAGVGIAIAAACHNLSVERPRWGVWLVGYLALAVGFLAKGPIAVLVYGPGALTAAVATRRVRRLVDWRHVSAALLFVTLAGGYLWGAYAAAGPRFFDQPLLEAKVRGLGWIWGQSEEAAVELAAFREQAGEAQMAARPARAVARTLAKPVFIWAAFLPWSVLLPAAFLRKGAPAQDHPAAYLKRSATGFLLAGILVFMATSTHEMRYYLPLAVPMAILCGLVAGGAVEPNRRWQRGLLFACLFLAALPTLAAALGSLLFETPPVARSARLALALAGLGGATAIAWIARRPSRSRLALLLTVSGLAGLAIETLALKPRRAMHRTFEATARELASHVPQGAPVWVPGPADIAGNSASLYFYLDRRVLAFRPTDPAPPPGSLCILPSHRLSEVEASFELEFRETFRAKHARRDYLLGACSRRTE